MKPSIKPKGKNKKDNLLKNSIVSIIIISLATIVFFKLFFVNPFSNSVSLNQVISDYKSGKVNNLHISSDTVTGTVKSTGEEETSSLNSNISAYALLKDNGIQIGKNSSYKDIYFDSSGPDIVGLISALQQ